jgi:hypothetical protein
VTGILKIVVGPVLRGSSYGFLFWSRHVF